MIVTKKGNEAHREMSQTNYLNLIDIPWTFDREENRQISASPLIAAIGTATCEQAQE